MESLLPSCRALSSPTTCRFILAHSVPGLLRFAPPRAELRLHPFCRNFNRQKLGNLQLTMTESRVYNGWTLGNPPCKADDELRKE